MKCYVFFIPMLRNAAAESTFIHHQEPQTHRNVLVFVTPALIKTEAINYYSNHIFYDNSGQIYLRNLPSLSICFSFNLISLIILPCA